MSMEHEAKENDTNSHFCSHFTKCCPYGFGKIRKINTLKFKDLMYDIQAWTTLLAKNFGRL